MTIDAASTKTPITDFIRSICERFGPRLPGTAAEAKAAGFIAEKLGEFCDEVAVEEHRFSPYSFTWSATVFVAVYLVSVVAYFWLPLLAALLVASSLIVFLLTRMKGYEILEQLYPQSTTKNVVGKVKPRATPQRTIIFSGHHDSALYMPVFEKRWIRIFVGAFFFSIISHFTLFFASALKLVSEWFSAPSLMNVSWPLWGVSALGAVVFTVVRFFMFRNVGVMGANDNLSGVGVAVEAARHFAANRPENTEVWAVSFGAEEFGMAGSKRFARKHRIELANAYLVNMEMVGAGAMIVVAGERTAGTRHSEEVASLIVESARRCGITMETIVSLFGESDSSSFSRLGLKAATIASFDQDGTPPKWHVLEDTLDNVDEAHLQDALKVCIECVNTVEQKLSPTA